MLVKMQKLPCGADVGRCVHVRASHKDYELSAEVHAFANSSVSSVPHSTMLKPTLRSEDCEPATWSDNSVQLKWCQCAVEP